MEERRRGASEIEIRSSRSSSSSSQNAVTKSVNELVGYEGLEVINPDGGTNDVHEEASKGRWKQVVTIVHVDYISKVQDDEVGDGTTFVVVFAGELLRQAEKLVAGKIHSMTIISGYRMTVECARDAMLKKVVDDKADSDKFKSDLMKIPMTTLSSKILSQDRGHFAQLAVDAVIRLQMKLIQYREETDQKDWCVVAYERSMHTVTIYTPPHTIKSHP